MTDRTYGGAFVGSASVNGGAEATDFDRAKVEEGYYRHQNDRNIEQIKEELLQRDSHANEFTKKPLDMFNRDLSVEDPEVNRELHDAMQDAEDLLTERRGSSNGMPGGTSSALKSAVKLFKNFAGSSDKSSINSQLRKSNDVVRRVEESTNLGKDIYLNLNASRVNLQNRAADLDAKLSELKLSHDDLMKPTVLESNPDVLVKVRELNAAKEHFADNCHAASEFTLAKNEDASTPSHCQTCNTNTLKRIEAELEQCSQVISPTLGEGEDAEPNPFFASISKAPDIDVDGSEVKISEPNDLENSELMEAIKEAVEVLTTFNPLKFLSSRGANQTSTNSM
ncbi:hypothetical protein [Vibrio alginolyticus]|uniref:hypothetical protein n=1 Tax=Vibrio alginolyticus TaxID=663 RepID=UPI0015F3EFA9|nr:hypothetical protein [Vibrio alginolyticus]